MHPPHLPLSIILLLLMIVFFQYMNYQTWFWNTKLDEYMKLKFMKQFEENGIMM